MKRKIIVCGATGNQGGSVARALALDPSWEVIGLSRDINASRSLALRRLGVDMVSADPMDLPSLKLAFEDAYGVFAVTQPWSADYRRCDTESEIRQASNILSAARAAKVQHLVMSSIINPESELTGASHVDSKLAIEKLTVDSDLPYSILRLPQFMDNLGSGFFPVKGNRIKGFVDADAKVPYIACKDIGPAVAEAFSRPDISASRIINLIGDFISGNELADLYSLVNPGNVFTYKPTSKIMMLLFAKEFYRMRLMFEKWGHAPYPAQIQETLKYGRSKTCFKKFLQEKNHLTNSASSLAEASN